MPLILTCSCSDVTLDRHFKAINITGFEEHEMDFASCASKVDTVFFRVKEGASPISFITSFDFDNEVLAVADGDNRISLFDINTGELLKQAKKVGHAADEYTEANVVKCHSDTIFLLDMQGRKIIKYDKNLNFVGKIVLDFIPLDFEVTDGGFLLSRLDAQEKDKRFIVIDRKGRVQYRMVPASPLGNQLVTIKSFTGNASGEAIYFHEPMSDKTYKWENGKAEPAFAFLFPDHNGNDPQERFTAILQDCFVTSNHLVCSFSYNHKVYYAIYSRTDGKMVAGSFDLKSGRPFSPMVQKGNMLTSLYHSNDMSALSNWKPKVVASELTLMVYYF